ncbi:hypothetical protein BOX15_Mlig013647g3, partial [Macrostomum lignano]
VPPPLPTCTPPAPSSQVTAPMVIGYAAASAATDQFQTCQSASQCSSSLPQTLQAVPKPAKTVVSLTDPTSWPPDLWEYIERVYISEADPSRHEQLEQLLKAKITPIFDANLVSSIDWSTEPLVRVPDSVPNTIQQPDIQTKQTAPAQKRPISATTTTTTASVAQQQKQQQIQQRK